MKYPFEYFFEKGILWLETPTRTHVGFFSQSQDLEAPIGEDP